MRARSPTGGQASVELVALLPVLVLVGAVVVQLVVAGHALWLCSNAARVAARAALVGGDAEAAARSALPSSLEDGLRVRAGEGLVEVVIRLPLLVPGLHNPLPIVAAARFPGVG
jgi:pilus assembly protein CpaE